MSSDNILYILTIIVPAIATLFAKYIPNWMMKTIQVKFIHEQGGTTVLLRNISNKVVYVDRVFLQQSVWVNDEIDIDDKRDDWYSLIMAPGCQKIIFLSTTDVECAHNSMVNGCGFKRFKKWTENRICFKMVLHTSVGVLYTDWFKIESTNGAWLLQDCLHHHSKTYNTKINLDFINVESAIFALMSVIYLILVSILLADFPHILYLLFAGVYILFILIVALRAPAGIKKPLYLALPVFVGSIAPAILAFVLTGKAGSIVMVFLPVAIILTIFFSRLFGWRKEPEWPYE